MHLRLPCTALLLALVAGCAAPINIRNAEAHAQAGYAAKARGDWDTARRQFAQAVVNADLGGADAAGKSQVNYEYGRVLGIMCDWDQSERYLVRSKQLVEESGRSPYLSLYELGLISEKQGKTAQAVKHFGELLPLMEEENLRARYPLGVADAYERYGAALAATRQPAEAERMLREARSIRAANPDAKPFGSVTPYGSACAKAS
jgi:tetratricopeptide (TPR) repeat protein